VWNMHHDVPNGCSIQRRHKAEPESQPRSQSSRHPLKSRSVYGSTVEMRRLVLSKVAGTPSRFALGRATNERELADGLGVAGAILGPGSGVCRLEIDDVTAHIEFDVAAVEELITQDAHQCARAAHEGADAVTDRPRVYSTASASSTSAATSQARISLPCLRTSEQMSYESRRSTAARTAG